MQVLNPENMMSIPREAFEILKKNLNRPESGQSEEMRDDLFRMCELLSDANRAATRCTKVAGSITNPIEISSPKVKTEHSPREDQ